MNVLGGKCTENKLHVRKWNQKMAKKDIFVNLKKWYSLQILTITLLEYLWVMWLLQYILVQFRKWDQNLRNRHFREYICLNLSGLYWCFNIFTNHLTAKLAISAAPALLHFWRKNFNHQITSELPGKNWI